MPDHDSIRALLDVALDVADVRLSDAQRDRLAAALSDVAGDQLDQTDDAPTAPDSGDDIHAARAEALRELADEPDSARVLLAAIAEDAGIEADDVGLDGYVDATDVIRASSVEAIIEAIDDAIDDVRREVGQTRRRRRRPLRRLDARPDAA